MKLFKALLGVGLGLSLLMGSAMAADEKPAKSEKKAAAGDKAAIERISGEITKVDADAVTVKVKDGSEKTFTLAKDAKVNISKSATDKQPATGAVADVKVGAFASARAAKDGDKLVAKQVTVAASADLLPSHKATGPAAGADAPKGKKAKKADATATPTPASN